MSSRLPLLASSLLTAATCAAALLAQPARAQVTTYTSAASFNAATTTDAIYTFENIAPAGGNSNSTPGPLLPLAFTANGYDGDTRYYIFDSASQSGRFSLNGTDNFGGAKSFNGASGATTINFGGSKTAFGTEIGSRGFSATPPTATFSIQLFNGAAPVGTAFSTGAITTAFAGFTSTQSFDRAVITHTTASSADTSYMMLDNIQLKAAVVAVPEPGTLALLGAGSVAFIGGVAIRRRRS